VKTFAIFSLLFFCFINKPEEQMTLSNENQSLIGAWELMSRNGEVVRDTRIMIVTPGYFAEASYNIFDKRFNEASAGTYVVNEGNLEKTFFVNSSNPNSVGTTEVSGWKIIGSSLMRDGHKNKKKWVETWEAINDEGNYPLTGAWRIAQRMQAGNMIEIQEGPRKTLKILSESRFQWIAFNSDTKEFFGTGGGIYSISEDKYTEHIEFFSRDSTRVGMNLTFDIDLKEDGWHHSGLSSKGDPVNEIWVQVDRDTKAEN